MGDGIFLSGAKLAISKGLPVFPLRPGGKIPAIIGWKKAATTDLKQIEAWARKNPDYNVGVSTEFLYVIDIDNAKGKKGNESFQNFKKETGIKFPKTYTQTTPTGGRHIFYRVNVPVKQGVSVLGKNVDIRASGGLVVFAGSVTKQGVYTGDGQNICDCPKELLARAQIARPKKEKEFTDKKETISVAALERGKKFLETAPVSIENAGGDDTLYKVCAKLHELGIAKDDCLEILQPWNERCEPPWSIAELQTKINNAFSFGNSDFGENAAEREFQVVEKKDDDTLSPVEKINKEFAFILMGGKAKILWETKDVKGFPTQLYLTREAFKDLIASKKIPFGNNSRPVFESWIASPDRRSYAGTCFEPGVKDTGQYYNLWRGFTVETPQPDEKFLPIAHKALEMFLEHAKENVCENNPEYFQWVMSWCANIFQRPMKKQLTALVLKGGKGVGKNIFIETIGNLLGQSFHVTSNKRYLVGNFNAHLQYNLLSVLDEAFWSGDKSAEGILKDVVTGHEHMIERKGQETFKSPNYTRVAVLGNEDWLVPASEDERRFCVLTVGDKRKQDLKFFSEIARGMNQGGDRLLLKYLLEFDCSKVELNQAPKTEGLYIQKLSSQKPFAQWYYACLSEKMIVGAEFPTDWPRAISTDDLRKAFINYTKLHRDIRSRLPSQEEIGRDLNVFAPGVRKVRRRKDGNRFHYYEMPTIEQARADWDKMVDFKTKWDKDVFEEEESIDSVEDLLQ